MSSFVLHTKIWIRSITDIPVNMSRKNCSAAGQTAAKHDPLMEKVRNET